MIGIMIEAMTEDMLVTVVEPALAIGTVPILRLAREAAVAQRASKKFLKWSKPLWSPERPKHFALATTLVLGKEIKASASSPRLSQRVASTG
jgi:hypothetical protein